MICHNLTCMEESEVHCHRHCHPFINAMLNKPFFGLNARQNNKSLLYTEKKETRFERAICMRFFKRSLFVSLMFRLLDVDDLALRK